MGKTYLLFLFISFVNILHAQDIYITYIASTYHNENNIRCHGAADGWIKIVFTVGRSPYLFNWSNGSYDQNLKNIPAGNYTLKITDADGLTGSISVLLVEPDPLVIQLNRSRYDDGFNISTYGGHDGFIESEISGGTNEYHYLWSNESTEDKISDLAEDTYSLTVTDRNGCQAKASVTLTEPKEHPREFRFK